MQPDKYLNSLATSTFPSLFLSPIETLTSFRTRPRWLVSILVSASVSAIANFYVIHRIGLIRIIETVSRNKDFVDPQGAIENGLALQNQILGIQTAIAFLGPCLVVMFIATVLWLLLILFGHNSPWKKVFAVVAYTNMFSTLLRELMTVLTVLWISDMNRFDMNNPLATNPAFFWKPVSSAAFRALSSLDILTFMNMALLIFGLTRICPNLSGRTASMMVAIPWMVYVGGMLVVPVLLS